MIKSYNTSEKNSNLNSEWLLMLISCIVTKIGMHYKRNINSF